MARIRSIHPGFFTDEAIVQADPLAQVFLIGLWTQCDDQGVFEWKPITLKMRILPAANCDVAVLLAELVGLGIIKQIDVGPLKYGLVRNFRKFQRPKKPNAIYTLPPEFRSYVGLDDQNQEQDDSKGGHSSPPVPHQFPAGSESPPLMEEGGGRRKEKEETTESVADSARANEAEPWEPVDDGLEIPSFLRKAPAARAQPIPPDWLPSKETQSRLVKARPDLTPERIIERTVEFRNWCAESNKLTHNPDATWFNFMVKTHAERHRKDDDRPAERSTAAALAGLAAAGARGRPGP